MTEASEFQRRCLLAALVPMMLAAAELALSTFGVSSMIPFFGFLLFFATGILALPVALHRAWQFAPERRGPLVGLLLLLCLSLVAFASMRHLSWPLRQSAFARAADRAGPVIDAIKRFERAEGKPPRSLAELVPVHLPAVPRTGLVAYPRFEYELFADTGGSLVWWDMGSRRGASMTGLWVYPDGDPDHAILAFELDGRGGVKEARMDRMPATTERRTFSPESWRANPDERLQMVHDLAKKHNLLSKNRPAIEQLLGPPSGSRVLRDSAWELRIPCSLGMLNWDVFFYWPSERYPEQIYGGRTQKIGRWAYVHE